MKSETGGRRWWFGIGTVRLPIDAAALGAFVLSTVAVVLFTENVAIRVLFGAPFLLFVPGYAVVTALYPARADGTALVRSAGLSGVERTALSFGISLVVLPIVALGVWVLRGGFDPAGVVGAVGLTALVLTAVGVRRRGRLPPDRRFEPPVRPWIARLRAAVTTGGTTGVLNVALLAVVVLAAATAAFVVAVPTDGATYTGFQLLTQADDGTYVASDYPTELAVGEPTPLVVGIDNHEGRSVEYTVVVELQRVSTAGGTTTVESAAELARLEATVAPGETARLHHTVSPSATGENRRLAYYLYAGDAPENPDDESAYRTLALWVDVGASDDRNQDQDLGSVVDADDAERGVDTAHRRNGVDRSDGRVASPALP